ncbi:MAG: hypothetical protein HC908_01015 [Calothrix sp. SM1_7_51]|nr:hypothetical protein [Calothrix sp. SM1_7_51]
MLVILTSTSIIPPQQVCQSCVLADSSGQPRLRGGQLCCGSQVPKFSQQIPDQYECMMGFRIAKIQ